MTDEKQHRVRTSDPEREQFAELIRAAMREGRLTMEEGEERLARVYAAVYRDELSPLVDDLPGGGWPDLAAGPEYREELRKHLWWHGVRVAVVAAVVLAAWAVLATVAHVPLFPLVLLGLLVLFVTKGRRRRHRWQAMRAMHLIHGHHGPWHHGSPWQRQDGPWAWAGKERGPGRGPGWRR